MKINPSKQSYSGKGNQNRKKKFSTKSIIFFLFIFSVVMSILVYNITVSYFPAGIKSWVKYQAGEYGFQQFHRKASLIHSLFAVPKHLSGRSKIPHIMIDLKFKHLEKLRRKREEAMKAGILETSDNDYVPAQIRYGNRDIKVKLRLKGDWTDHLEGKKWSSRIHVSGKDHLFGMRRFSIQHPKTRGYQSEILYFETLRKYGILAPRYFFVNVTFNGDDIGVMAIEEHFSKELLEHNARREGVILKFDESLVWAATDGADRGFGGVYDDYLNADIDAFRLKKTSTSPTLSREYAIAVGLLRSFMAGDLTASAVFDTQQLGGFIAVAEIFRSPHAVRWHNLRFYFNPISMKLEPIGFDGDIHHPTNSSLPLYKEEPILTQMMEDPALYESYQRILNQIIDDYRSGELVEFLKKVENEALAQLRKEFFLLDTFNYARLAEHLSLVAQGLASLDIQPEKYPKNVFAYLIDEKGNRYLELFNALPFDVNVSSLNWVNTSGITYPFKTTDLPSLPFLLPAAQSTTKRNGLRLHFQESPPAQNLRLEVMSNIKGSQTQRVAIAENYYPLIGSSGLPAGDIDDLLEKNPFLFLYDSNTISTRKGDWIVLRQHCYSQGL